MSLTQLPHRRGPRAAPAAGARRHARAGSSCAVANQGTPPLARCSACATRCPAPAAPACWSARSRPGESARAAYRLPTERRGILTVGPLEVELTDPFGLARVGHARPSGASELTVYPHIDDAGAAAADHRATTRWPAPSTPTRSAAAARTSTPCAHYVVGDDLRRVHWPSTARHDELMVRQDELPWQGRATVLLDVRRRPTPPSRSSWSSRPAASIVAAGARRQDLVRLVTTDGADSGFAAGHAHVEAIMEHLASVEATNDAGFQRVLDRLARSAGGGALVVVVAAAVGRRPRPARPGCAAASARSPSCSSTRRRGTAGPRRPPAARRATACCASPRDASVRRHLEPGGRARPPADAARASAPTTRRRPRPPPRRRRRLGPLRCPPPRTGSPRRDRRPAAAICRVARARRSWAVTTAAVGRASSRLVTAGWSFFGRCSRSATTPHRWSRDPAAARG